MKVYVNADQALFFQTIFANKDEVRFFLSGCMKYPAALFNQPFWSNGEWAMNMNVVAVPISDRRLGTFEV